MRIPFILSLVLLSGCGTDKVLHMAAGAGVGAVTDEAYGDYGCEAAIAIGLAKELIDPIFSTPDLIATAAYCLVPLL